MSNWTVGAGPGPPTGRNLSCRLLEGGPNPALPRWLSPTIVFQLWKRRLALWLNVLKQILSSKVRVGGKVALQTNPSGQQILAGSLILLLTQSDKYCSRPPRASNPMVRFVLGSRRIG